jgi:3-hydroxymyristoyl/3-hydroxydecanoyl-(acyl carrier protein) dehydratase
MKNLKIFTCKKHDAFTWKNLWIDIKLHDLNFKTQVGPKEKQDKTKQIVKEDKKNQTRTQKKLKVNDNVI